MSLPDDDAPRKATVHEVGCDLSIVSVDELNVRIALLRKEIDRIEAECLRKSAGRQAAENLFRS